MFDLVAFGGQQAIAFILILVRVSGLFILAPVFGEQDLSTVVKVALAIILSIVLLPVAPLVSAMPPVTSVWGLLGLAFGELLVGVTIGMFFRFIFHGVLMAGAMIGYQIGFMFANLFDTNLNEQISVISRFWYLVAMLLFLSIDGHHLVINALAESYQVIPPGQAGIDGSFAEAAIRYSAYAFVLAIKIAAPVTICLFLTDVALGTIAKTIPTMNVFFVGFPIKIAVGLLVMAMSMPMFAYVMEKAMGYMDDGLRSVLYSVGKV